MRARLFGLLSTIAFAITVMPAQAEPGNFPGHGYINIPNPELMLEHLVHHSDMLVTNINLTRASGFRVEQAVIQGIIAQPCWAASFYTDVIAAVRRPQDPDVVGYMVGQLAYTFRMKVIGLYDIAMNVGPSPDLAAQFEQVNFTYFNAISATYFYIESLRRGLLLPQLPQPLRNRALLVKRLQLLERNAAEVQNLMYAIRYAAAFRFPIGRNCIECTFAPVRINVMAQGRQEVLFPYYANEKVMFPDQQVRRMEAPAQYNPMYQTAVWNNRWNVIDQGYLNPAAGGGNYSGGGYSGGAVNNSGGGNYGGSGGNGGNFVQPYTPGNGGGQQVYGPQPLNNGGQPQVQNGGQPQVQNGGQPQVQNGGQPQVQNGGQPQVQNGGQPQVQNGGQPQLGQGGTITQPLPTMPQGGNQKSNYTPGAYDY